MLSKEEIEKSKEDFNFFNEGDYITKEMVRSKEKIFEYIKELESDNYEQNNIINDYIDERRELIEKLEEANKKDTYTVKNFEGQYRNSTNEGDKISYKRNIDMANARREVRKHVLEILKGENHGNQARIYRDYK